MQQQPAGTAGAAEEPVAGATGTATTSRANVNGGRFDFDDGGTYCGGWEDGKAHGHGVCTGPKGQGAYSGSWHYGFEVSGVYTWPSGSAFEGQWQNGKRHGLGVETRGRWIYRGEWNSGFKGRYGVRQSNTSMAQYGGTWANGLQEGYGSETYADEGTYQGQWLQGMRNGYGVRNSAPFGKASKYRANKANLRASLTSLRSTDQGGHIGGGGGGGNEVAAEQRDRRVTDSRGGFVLKVNSSEPAAQSGGRRRSIGTGNFTKMIKMTITKQKSTSELEKKGASGSMRSTMSSASWRSTDSAQSVMTNASLPSDSNASFVVEDEQMDPATTEMYRGEWKNDKRTGFGVSERSDGLKYEGEWYNNKKYGYGVTTFSNGEKEEGKYKNNVLITNPNKKHKFLMRSTKFRERIDAAVSAAQRASKIAMQKADIAISRTATARGKAEQADRYAEEAHQDSDMADSVARQYAPDFRQPGLERLKAKQRYREPYKAPPQSTQPLLQQQSAPISTVAPSVQQHTLPTIQIKQSTPAPMMPNNTSHQPPNMPHAASARTDFRSSSYALNQTPAAVGANKMEPSSNGSAMVNDLGYMNMAASGISEQPEPSPRRGRTSLTSMEQSQISTALRRNSRRISTDRPYLGSTAQPSSIDHFDHYKRPPSRDSSVDRYSRATGRGGGNIGIASRQTSIDRSTPIPAAGAGAAAGNPGHLLRASVTPDRTTRAPSAMRATTPTPTGMPSSMPTNGTPVRNGSVLTGSMTKLNAGNGSAPFEDILLKKRNLGQDIIPSMNQPKRTESLYMAQNPQAGVGEVAAVAKNVAAQSTLQRKKSLPEFQELPRRIEAMSREEVSTLGSARREEVRRMAEENERLRANPLLYLVSPQVKDWFSRQQLVLIILFVNISLAIMFFKLLT